MRPAVLTAVLLGLIHAQAGWAGPCDTATPTQIKHECMAFTNTNNASHCERAAKSLMSSLRSTWGDSYQTMCTTIQTTLKSRRGCSSAREVLYATPGNDGFEWCQALTADTEKSAAGYCRRLRAGPWKTACAGMWKAVHGQEPARERWATVRESVPSPVKTSEFGRPVEEFNEVVAIGAPLPSGKRSQRQYTRIEYAKMWAAAQSTELTPEQQDTLLLGCVGVTAVNLAGTVDPLEEAEALFNSFDQAKAYMDNANRLLSWLQDADNPATRFLIDDGSFPADWRYVIFGKHFWSNQRGRNPDIGGKESDVDAFPPDPETGEIDLDDFRASYKYKARPTEEEGGYGNVNFDYAFFEEASGTFWHANHGEYDDAEEAAADPMIVLQSTAKKFAAGYDDFDRILYGVALAKTFKAKQTAHFWAAK